MPPSSVWTSTTSAVQPSLASSSAWASAVTRVSRITTESPPGESLDADRIDARYEDGVLTLVIPVAESAKPRKIQISTSETKALGKGSEAA
jgi:HSP20 family protein